jgi:DNA-binding beta-propeller fold protein YncE
MTTFAKRRVRSSRVTAREPRRPGRILLYIGIAIGFAAIGFAASLGGGSAQPSATIEATPIAGRPSAIAITKRAAFVTDDQSGLVRVLDLSKARRRRRAIRVGPNPISVAAGKTSVFVGHANGDITRISLATLRVDGRVHAGGSITGLVVDGSRLWAADLQRAEIEAIDTRTLRVVRRVRDVPAVRVIASGSAIWATTSSDELIRYDIASRTTHRVRVGAGPIGLVLDRDDVWAAVSDASSVVDVDARTLHVRRRVRVGHGPVNLALAHGVIWVTNNDDSTLSQIDASSGRVLGAPLSVSSDLRGAAADGRVWFVGTDPSGVFRTSR